jgi:DNA replication and repair protein RecF
MRLIHLSLNHFRNYHSLELDFSGALTLLQGDNAQGKTNLLEAIHFLATSKSIHAQSEREVVNWGASDEPIPYARIAGTVVRSDDPRPLELEIILTPRGDGVNFKKQVRVNGVNKRSMDLIGNLRAVLFLPDDIALVADGPGVRRRYLDIALCQMDRTYCRALSAYQKVVTQRNSLLKTLREQGASPSAPTTVAQLSFWDEQLVRHGSLVMAKRGEFIRALEAVARIRHAELSDDREALEIYYMPSFNVGPMSEADYQRLKNGRGLVPKSADASAPFPDAKTVTARYLAQLEARRARELAAGSALYGPHRDDMRLLANGRDLRLYGSRGQQRTAALALKLAEVHVMTEATGTAPVLLLDDVMSELDARRRGALLNTLEHVRQAIITATDWDDFAPEFRRNAQQLTVRDGRVEAVDV